MADSIESEMTFGDLLSARTDSYHVPMVNIDSPRSNSEFSVTSDFVIGPRNGKKLIVQIGTIFKFYDN